MRILFKKKDGGPFSKATGYWLIEWKRAFSIVLLRFDSGSRDAYHDHAFNAISWVLSGGLLEKYRGGFEKTHKASITPIWTPRECFHKVFGLHDRTWVLSFRGPWVDQWREDLPNRGIINLTHGRKEV